MMKKFLYHNILALSILCIGVFGLVGGFYQALELSTYNYVMTGFWIFMAVLLYVLKQYYCLKQYAKKIKYITIAWILLVGSSVLFLLDVLSLFNGIQEVIANDYYLNFDALFTLYQTPFPVIIIVYTFFGFIVTKMIVHYMVEQTYRRPLFILSIAWIFFPFFINHSVDNIYIYASILFLLSSYIYTTTLVSLHGQGNIIGCVVLVVLIGMLSIFDQTIGQNAVVQREVVQIFDGLSYLKHGTKNEGNQTGSNTKPETDLPTGNIAINTDEALVVTTTKPFSGYLRGYSLSTYYDNGWDTPKIGYRYPSVNYYAKAMTDSTSLQVQVTSLKGHTYQFLPYHTNVAGSMTLDSFLLVDDIKYTLYQGKATKQVNIDQEYMDYIKENYLDINDDTKILLERYLNVHNVNTEALKTTSLEQKITFISSLLAKNTSYSLTPGGLPLGKDFIDYFLNDSKQGSCTHYATTGTLLLRLLGVPTRYTSGYVVDENDFKDNVATIRNNRSHAWIEVFDEQYGWYPIDMTPANVDQQETPEVDPTPRQITTMLDQQSNIPQDPPTTNGPTTNTPTKDPVETTEETINEWITPVLSVGAAILLMVVSIGQYRYRYQRKIHKYQALSTNQKIKMGYQSLVECGLVTTPVEDLYLKAAFSQHQITAKELQDFENYMVEQRQIMYQQIPKYKKWIFRYIKAKG